MTHLTDVSADDLRGLLADVEGKRPTQRVMVALNYKEEEITQPALAARYGISEGTVHNWLSRLDRLGTEPADEVLYDDKRGPKPGQTRQLSAVQSDRLTVALRGSPEAVGYDVPVWTSTLAKQYIREAFGVEYSRRHVRRLMSDAGLSPRTGRGSPTADERDRRDGASRPWTAQS